MIDFWISKTYLITELVKTRFRHDIKIGKKTRIGLGCKFWGRNAIGRDSRFIKSELGFGSYVGQDSFIYRARIGKYTSIGKNFAIVAGRHPVSEMVSTHPSFFSTQKQCGFTFVTRDMFNEYRMADEHFLVTIGSDVWIGEGVRILDGITIGHGAIIATGSVVTKDVEPYCVVGGVPAKLIKKRFDDGEIKTLLHFAWWDKPFEWIAENHSRFENVKDCILFMEKE